MDEICDYVQDKYCGVLSGHEYLGLSEWNNSVMEFDGNDPERV